jgi:hypothetical protein
MLQDWLRDVLSNAATVTVEMKRDEIDEAFHDWPTISEVVEGLAKSNPIISASERFVLSLKTS